MEKKHQEIGLAEIHKIQLNILKNVDEICRHYNIEYSLIGGSLLGAIRHKGFIPWDDDIDIMLTRDNYEKLFELLYNDDVLPANLDVMDFRHKNAFQPYAKIFDNRTYFESDLDYVNTASGVYIDVFPYDALPDEKKKSNKFRMRSKYIDILLVAVIKRPWEKGKFLKNIFLKFLHLFVKNKYESLVSKSTQYSRKYEKKETNSMGFIRSRYKNEHFPKKIFDFYEDISFEQLTVRKIEDHKKYLGDLYGDYMKLPPMEDRESHDFYKWYWKEGKEK
ncbi:LicD family protein [Lactococcus termiticola]|uniref:Lipopolysaccharide cholinephosphotransferase n=1 Tax=Lactococcus termiticola TaxID=2169526 RepID=A0A2R5HEN7_9LACT|nr:LicD family protein [Lactococcus termiticola]GBG96544.1 lipopolysaccharide cholinephosphotransferase [Lactococcus termiticola]